LAVLHFLTAFLPSFDKTPCIVANGVCLNITSSDSFLKFWAAAYFILSHRFEVCSLPCFSQSKPLQPHSKILPVRCSKKAPQTYYGTKLVQIFGGTKMFKKSMLRISNQKPFASAFSFANAADNFKQHWQTMLLTLMFFSGIVAGSLTFKSFSSTGIFIKLAGVPVLGSETAGVFGIIAGCFFYSCIITAVIFVLGLSAPGSLPILAVPFLKGLGLGIACANIYFENRLAGIVRILVLLIPAAMISVPALILLCREGIRASSGIFKMVAMGDNSGQTDDRFKVFIGKITLYLVAFLASAFVQGLMVALFANKLAIS
jgi:hypothetical protein